MKLNIDPSIFRAYDIRGIYPDQVNENSIKALVKAFLLRFQKSGFLKPGGKILLATDARTSSPSLKDSAEEVILETGVDVDYMGQVTNDSFYFSVGKLGYAGGIYIGASHNPLQYNGIKGVAYGVDFIRGVELKQLMPSISELSEIGKSGRMNEVDLLPGFAEYTLREGFAEKLKQKKKVVLDPGNGTAVRLIPHMLPGLPIEPTVINGELDGTFPGRGPNPYAQGATQKLAKTILDVGADFGVAWDNDADRILFVDEKGRPLPGDILAGVLCSFLLLKKHPGATIVHDAVASKSLQDVVGKLGGRTKRTKVGYVFIKQGMMEANGILGVEISGHFQFPCQERGRKWSAENTWLAIIYILHILEQTGRKLSELVNEITLYHKSDVITFEITDARPILAKLKNKYSTGRQDELDGLTVEYDDWWFNVRPSNTEPILKMVVEGKTEKELEAKKAELISLISG